MPARSCVGAPRIRPPESHVEALPFQTMDSMSGEITYITRGEEVVWGIALVAVSLVIHGLGMILTLHITPKYKRLFRRPEAFFAGITSVVLASWMIMVVHILEVAMWSAFFQWKECFPNYSTAIYFAGLEYTTVGSALNLPRHWRLLEIMIASAGLLGFAWSTGVMMTLAQEFQDQQLRVLRVLERGARRRPAPAVSDSPNEPGEH